MNQDEWTEWSMSTCAAFTRALAVATVLCGAAVHAAAPLLCVETKIALGNIKGRIDHLALDERRKRLYIAELGNDSVGVVDLSQLKLARTISGFSEPQGIAYVPLVDAVYVANGGDGTVRVFSAADLSETYRIDLGDDADNVRVDPKDNRVYVGHGSGALAIIDPAIKKRLFDIPLKGHPESFQLEGNGSHIFVNVPEANGIEIIDRENISKRVGLALPSMHANFPMALDETQHRLFVAFRNPAQLAMFDLSDNRFMDAAVSCGDADDVFVDTKRARIYVACGEGFIDVFESHREKLVRVDRLGTSPGARTALYSADMDRLFLAVRATDSTRAEVWIVRPQ
jgi:DNA-binding beta-propeller fold protein YncE